jgi:3-phenylpropionate/cinnamic acid dioxygenase small subunit
MSLTAEQTLEIHRLVSLHGHLCDSGDFDAFDTVLTDDIVYDLEALGHGTTHGRQALSDAARALGEANPAGHHVTNIMVTESPAGEIRARSKFLAVQRDGRTASGVYEDRVTLTPAGWRIAHRAVLPSNAPLRSGS